MTTEKFEEYQVLHTVRVKGKRGKMKEEKKKGKKRKKNSGGKKKRRKDRNEN